MDTDAAWLDTCSGATAETRRTASQASTSRALRAWAGICLRETRQRLRQGAGRLCAEGLARVQGASCHPPAPGRRARPPGTPRSHTLLGPRVCLCLETLRVHRGRKRLPEIPNPEWKNERNQPSGPGTTSVGAGGQSRVLHGNGGQAALQFPAGQSKKGNVASCGVLTARGRRQVPAARPALRQWLPAARG